VSSPCERRRICAACRVGSFRKVAATGPHGFANLAALRGGRMVDVLSTSNASPAAHTHTYRSRCT
jgi:hypothetical protein